MKEMIINLLIVQSQGNADYIVTNDKHFNIIKQIYFPPLQILNIDEFMKIYKNIIVFIINNIVFFFFFAKNY